MCNYSATRIKPDRLTILKFVLKLAKPLIFYPAQLLNVHNKPLDIIPFWQLLFSQEMNVAWADPRRKVNEV